MFELAFSFLEKREAKGRGAGSRPFLVETLNQEVSLHPGDAGRGLLGDDRAVGNDILWDAFPGLFTAGDGGNTGRNSPAMNTA